MKVARSLAEFDALRRTLPGRSALVPTMGALHEGHLSLVDIARECATRSIVTIFVNPTQFGENDDFDTYPRHVERDLQMLESVGADLTFLPRLEDVYPGRPEARIRTGPAAIGLESTFRPHFFEGVVTVVHRLFEMVKPDAAVFGEKDFQQLQVIREMVEAHAMEVEIMAASTTRDEHGLALSSRNAYLSAEELQTARVLNQVLFDAADRIAASAGEAHALQAASERLLAAGFTSVDYVAFKPEWSRVLAAATIGRTRLIDNCAIPSTSGNRN